MRAFVAVEITDVGLVKKISELQAGLKIKARPVSPANMHFTLQFLGDVAETAITGIQAALRCVSFEPFALRLSGIGAFPGTKSPRVVWVGVDSAGRDRLSGLAGTVRDALSQSGFGRDGQFRPHVTIFRIKNKADITRDLEEFQNVELGCQRVSRIKLKKSVLTPDGPVYSDLLEVAAKQ